MIWQRLIYHMIGAEKKVDSIDAITNYRIFQYDYNEHRGAAILFPSLQDATVTSQQRTANTILIGSYFISSFNLTGIKNVRTNNVVGDIVFYAKDGSAITFTQITDPETLSIAIKTLKRQYANIDVGTGESKDKNTTIQHTDKIETDDTKTNLSCGKCGNIASSTRAKYCGKCGSALSPMLAEYNTPLHIDDQSREEVDRIIENPEQQKNERHQNLRQRVDEYKPAWDKNGVIQYKTEYMAILQRKWDMQVEFIIAFDDLSREGYRLMAVDEGKSGGDSSGGFTGGVNAYFYFQKMKYVK